jgi:hypothetical protein
MSHRSNIAKRQRQKRRHAQRPQPQPKPTTKPSATSGLIGELAQPLHTIAWSQAIAEVQTTKT